MGVVTKDGAEWVRWTGKQSRVCDTKNNSAYIGNVYYSVFSFALGGSLV